MKHAILTAALVSALSFGAFATSAFAAAAVPCEEMLVKLGDAEKTSKPADVDLAAYNDLKAKAEERCTAEDDRRSDGFIEEAMKLLVAK